jgi:hypothetical protein
MGTERRSGAWAAARLAPSRHWGAGQRVTRRILRETVELSPGSTSWRHGDLRPLLRHEYPDRGVIRSDRSTTCAPDGILAKDRIAAACRCWQPVAPGVTGYETELSIPTVETTCACAFGCTGSTSITKRVATSSSICSPLMTGTTSTPPWPRTCRWGSRRCGPFACGRGGQEKTFAELKGGRRDRGDHAGRHLPRARPERVLHGIACLESWTLPGRFLRRRLCPVWATCATQRVVARVLPMMRVEAAEGPADGGPRPDNRAIHVDRQAGRLESGQRLGHEIPIQGDQRRQLSCVNCRNQSATVRRVGNRAKPQKRVTIGSPPR